MCWVETTIEVAFTGLPSRYSTVTWLLASGPSVARLAGFPRVGEQLQDLVGVVDRRRHQLRRLAAGVAEHDALVAGALVLVAGGVDALRDVGRLRVQQDFDFGVLPVKAFLLVADVVDGGARRFLDLAGRDAFRAAHLAGDDDAVGGGQRLAGDARFRHRAEEEVDDRIRDAVADLVRVTFGNGFGW